MEMEKFRLLARAINEMTMPMNWIFDVTMHTHTHTHSRQKCLSDWVNVWEYYVHCQVDVCVLTCGKWHTYNINTFAKGNGNEGRKREKSNDKSEKDWKTDNNKMFQQIAKHILQILFHIFAYIFKKEKWHL